MKKLALILGIILLIGVLSVVEGQNIAITDDNAYTAHSSAMLDVKSLTKGLLTPRMTTVQRNAIALPATGLLVFDTNINGYYYYNGTEWINLSTGGTTGPFWTYNSPNIYMTTGTDKLGLGTPTPSDRLIVTGTTESTTRIKIGYNGSYNNIESGRLAFDEDVSVAGVCGFEFHLDGSANTLYLDAGCPSLSNIMTFERGGNIGIGTTTPETKLIVKGSSTTGIDEAIFAVQNTNGDTVFAVYPEGVRIWVNDAGGSKANGSRGGFAVGGFNPAKAGLTNEYFRVTPDSVRVYIDDDYVSAKANGSRGGFAVGGFNPAKGAPTDHYLFVQDDSTRVYVADSMEGFGVENIEGLNNQRISRFTTENYFIGHESGVNITNGKYNSFFGYRAGMKTTGGALVVNFPNDFQDEWEGSNNIFIGNMSGHENTTGHENVFVGKLSGMSNTTGVYNTYVGYQSGGYSDGTLSTGSFNAFMGCKSGVNNIDGAHNVFLGNCSGWENTSGTGNSFLGSNSGFHCTTGDYNVFLGNRSGFNNYTGFNNTYIGYHSGEFSTGGSNNIFIGYYAGQNESGSDKLYIENSNSASPLIYGEFDNDIVTINGSLGIGTTTPSEVLDVVGNVYASGGDLYTGATDGVINCGGGIMSATVNVISDGTLNNGYATGDEDLYINDCLEVDGNCYKTGTNTWTVQSDIRLKKDIKPYKDGLEQVMQIKPVYFKYNEKAGVLGNKEYIGVIAQEIKKIAPYTVELTPFNKHEIENEKGEVVGEKWDGTEYYTFNSHALTFMLINAVKEQQKIIEELRNEIKEIDQLKAEMKLFKKLLNTSTKK